MLRTKSWQRSFSCLGQCTINLYEEYPVINLALLKPNPAYTLPGYSDFLRSLRKLLELKTKENRGV